MGNIFKLSQGEYIAVEKVENTYGKSGLVNQIWVYGNSYKPFIVAVVVPDALQVVKELGDKFDCSAAPATPEWVAAYKKAVTSDEDFQKSMREKVMASLKANVGKLKGFEKVKGIICEYDFDELLQGFNVANNCLTPSFKLKRPQLKKRYMTQLKALYAELGDPAGEQEDW